MRSKMKIFDPYNRNLQESVDYNYSKWFSDKYDKTVLIEVVGDKEYVQNGLSATTVEKLKLNLDYVEQEKFIRFIIPKENAAYSTVTRVVQLCAYSATKEYLDSLLGIKLSIADETWFKEHPLVETNGLPQKYTVTILNELVEPYGIGVSKVYVPKGSSINEELILWQEILGVNPLARRSSNIDNTDYYESLCNGDPKMLKELIKDNEFGFEYRDELPKPCVVFNRVSSNKTVSFATGGGHSSYLSPREEQTTGWALAIQFDRIKNCNRFKEIPRTKYTKTTTKTLDLYRCKCKDGRTVSTVIYSPTKSNVNNVRNVTIKQLPASNSLDQSPRILHETVLDIANTITKLYSKKEYRSSKYSNYILRNLSQDIESYIPEEVARFCISDGCFINASTCIEDAKEYYGIVVSELRSIMKELVEIKDLSNNNEISAELNKRIRQMAIDEPISNVLAIAELNEMLYRTNNNSLVTELIKSTRKQIVKELYLVWEGLALEHFNKVVN